MVEVRRMGCLRWRGTQPVAGRVGREICLATAWLLKRVRDPALSVLFNRSVVSYRSPQLDGHNKEKDDAVIKLLMAAGCD